MERCWLAPEPNFAYFPAQRQVYAALGQCQQRRARGDTPIGKPQALLIGRVFNVRLLVH